MNRSKLTIKDIARMAGVSHTTVSRALNNKPRISQKTQDKILSIVKKHNYQPNAIARGLVLKRTNLIGLILSDITNPFYPEIARGIEDTARLFNYSVIFCSTDNNPSLQEAYVDILRQKGIDGMIFASVQVEDPQVEKLVEEGFPVVLVNRNLKNEKVDYVVLNNVLGAYQAVEHLLKLGHRRLGIIRGPQDLSTGVERYLGYRQALAKYGIPLETNLIVDGDFKKSSGYLAAQKLLAIGDRPTAIFCSNDNMALGAMEAIWEADLRVPEDVALVGFDDIEFASFKGVGLTTVSQRKYEMGSMAVKILIEKITKGEREVRHRIQLEPKLIIRESCGYKIKRGYLI